MARYVTSVPTPMSQEQAYRFMSDITQFPTWDPGVAAAVQVRGDGPVVGAAYDLTIRSQRKMVMRYEVVEVDAPKRVKLIAETPWLRSVDEIRVDARGTGSVVTYDAVLTLRGVFGVFDPLLALAFKRIGDRAAAGLRRVLAST